MGAGSHGGCPALHRRASHACCSGGGRVGGASGLRSSKQHRAGEQGVSGGWREAGGSGKHAVSKQVSCPLKKLNRVSKRKALHAK